MQTYQDTINVLLKQSVILPSELLTQVEDFAEENKHLGYTAKEEFIREAICYKLIMLSQEYEHIEISKEQYYLVNETVKKMNTPYLIVDYFAIT